MEGCFLALFASLGGMVCMGGMILVFGLLTKLTSCVFMGGLLCIMHALQLAVACSDGCMLACVCLLLLRDYDQLDGTVISCPHDAGFEFPFSSFAWCMTAFWTNFSLSLSTNNGDYIPLCRHLSSCVG